MKKLEVCVNFAAMYKALRSFLFFFDAESVHYLSMNFLKFLCRISPVRKLLRHIYSPNEFKNFSFLNLSLTNRIGLGAGFDKNAKYLRELETFGFGFIEIGTVTPVPQKGNDRPRLFRLEKDKALINRMGFNNDGADKIAKRLQSWKNKNSTLIIGGNIGKNKDTPNEEAWKDYETCFLRLHNWVDYFVVNVSSPNTPGLRALQNKNELSRILKNLQAHNQGKEKSKPILLKISPDLSKDQIDDIIDLSLEINLDGLIIANTSISREHLITAAEDIEKTGAGGMSGFPLREKSTELIRYINTRTNNKIPVIASGGIFNGPDALDKMMAGASLVQVWTGFIYEGPKIVKNISTYLAAQTNTTGN